MGIEGCISACRHTVRPPIQAQETSQPLGHQDPPQPTGQCSKGDTRESFPAGLVCPTAEDLGALSQAHTQVPPSISLAFWASLLPMQSENETISAPNHCTALHAALQRIPPSYNGSSSGTSNKVLRNSRAPCSMT